jgi:ribosomal protein RSM22 (predicted rRNA methylase)
VLPPSVAAVVESIAHDIPPQELRTAAAALSASYRQGDAATALAATASAAAYAVVRMPATFAAVGQALAQLERSAPF